MQAVQQYQYEAAVGEQYGGLTSLPLTGGFDLRLFLAAVAIVLIGIGFGHLAKRYRR
jgi:hypothetical protein